MLSSLDRARVVAMIRDLADRLERAKEISLVDVVVNHSVVDVPYPGVDIYRYPSATGSHSFAAYFAWKDRS